MAGRLGHALLTGTVRRNVCSELAPSLYIETPLAVISCGEGSFCVFGEMDRGDRVVEGQKVVLWGSFS